MSKKNDITIHADAKKKPEAKREIFAMTLIIGEWKNEFPELKCKVMIAEALNDCVCNEGLHIAGYLITKRRVCLVLKIQHIQLNKMLQLFYEKLRKEIQRHSHRSRRSIINIIENEEIIAEEKRDHLFVKHSLHNDPLIKLMTGRPVHLPYYSPHIARLKDKIHNYNFCSAMDYSGAKGPVIVSLGADRELM